MSANITEQEVAKYTKIWQQEQYDEVSPGANFASYFTAITGAKPGATVLDIGAGSGAGSVALKRLGFDVTAFDLVGKGWKHPDIYLMTGSIWHGVPCDHLFDYAYCCDMMEHIPTQMVGLAVSRVLEHSKSAFFTVCFNADTHGAAVRETLHLTVQPFRWWLDTMKELGTVFDARDLMGMGTFHVGT